MSPISIAYHDVVDDLRVARGIAQGHTTLYTIDRRMFREHLHAIAAMGTNAELVPLEPSTPSQSNTVYLTVDDGAVSSYCVADEMERLGWRGHFFVTTGWVGHPGFLDREQVRDLVTRGHIVGSHSCTHPDRMSHLSGEQLAREWKDSCAMLADITGRSTVTASVPGGYYSRAVAEAAAEAGIRVLFTSEPTARQARVSSCFVLGRYSVRRTHSAGTVARIAAGAVSPRAQQAVGWFIKKSIRYAAGDYYLRLRTLLLARSH
jgi:peptidoglycan/xylan/chitin deacetylase (PgdA/CDA1 family)